MVRWYSLALSGTAKHKCRAPLKFKWRLEQRYQRYKHHDYNSVNSILQQSTFIIRMTPMLLKKCSKKDMVTQHENKRQALHRGKQRLVMC